ncbi:MAG: peptidoglycan DD-metalloendopeptidase family protein [Patescibacteria group bacterium]
MKLRPIIIILLFIICLFFSNTGSASRIDELREKIEQRKSQAAQIEEEIKKYQEEINKTLEDTKTLKNHIKRLDVERKKILADVKLTEKEIEITNLNIEELGNQIKDKNSEIEKKRTYLAELIKKINELDSQNVVEIILSKDNFSDFFDDIEMVENLQVEMNVNLEDLKTLKSSLESEKKNQEEEMDNLKKLSTKLSDQKKLNEINKTNKNKLLTETKNKEFNYRKVLTEKLKLKEILDKEIFNYEAQLKYELDPKTIPPAGSGVLRWPLDKIFITQKFGVTSSSRRLYVSGSHNGVDFRASEGTRVLSAGEGIVDGTGDTDIACPGASFGKWVLIKYDNGLATTYGHLSLIKVSKGEKVSNGQLVGYSGNTGYSTGPHLHVTVYPKNAVNIISRPSVACSGRLYTLPAAAVNAYLDPLLYF